MRRLLAKTLKLAAILGRPEWRSALRRAGVAAATELRRVAWQHDFKTVIDVGAHSGQFALLARALFPEARILCLEPLEGPRSTIRRVVPGASVLAYAAGSESALKKMHVTNSSDSSSLRRPTLQTTIFPGTDEVAEEEVRVARLDEIESLGPLQPPVLLKLDVQGSELEALSGAPETLANVSELLVEVSFVELYDGQATATAVINLIQESGFDLIGVYDQKLVERRPIQADLHFVRASSIRES